jgi:hypothetical protein
LHQTAHRIADIYHPGPPEILPGQDAFCRHAQVKEMPPEGSGQQAAPDRRGQQTVSSGNENIGDAALGHLALPVDEQDFMVPFFKRALPLIIRS